MKMTVLKVLTSMMLAVFTLAAAAHQEQEDKSWWWNEAWWNNGQIETFNNYTVKTEWTSYQSRDVEVPVMVARPAKPGKFPAVFFQHGRRGLGDLVQRHARRLAARGFVVYAPDIYKAHFLGTHPVEHDYELEKDVNAGVTELLKRKDISTEKACLYSHTRGGYYTLKVATTFKRQQKDVACYVSYYPHLQDPNAPEPLQVYGFAPEVEQLSIPVMVFIGDEEQYQRRRVIESGLKALNENGGNAQLVIYPGVGRGFDFRPPHVRTFADDLASKDAVQRAARFIRKHLGVK